MTTPATPAAASFAPPVARWRPDAAFALRLVATVASLGAVVAWSSLASGESEHAMLLVPQSFLVLAAFSIHVPHPATQVLARAAWWSSFVVGVIVATCGSHSEAAAAAAIAVATGTGLFAVGGRWLERSTDAAPRFSVRARRAFTSLAMLAVAEVQSLLLYGALNAKEGRDSATIATLVAATALGLGAAGVGAFASARALAVHVAICCACGALLAADVLHLPWQLAAGVGVGLALQVVASGVAGFSLKDPPVHVDDAPPLRAWAPRIAVAALALVAVACAVTHTRLFE